MHPNTAIVEELLQEQHEQEAGGMHDCPAVLAARRGLHEIANALTLVQNQAQRLRLHGGANGSLDDSIAALDRATQHAGAVLKSVRQSLAGNGISVPQTPLVPRTVILEALTMIGPMIPHHVGLELDLRKTPLIRASREQLQQALINLILNALVAVRPGDRIRLAASSTDGWVDLSVSDTGPGMSPEVLGRCCEEGFTTKRNGSGLGLAIVESTVDASGGTLRIKSEPGQGTTVTLSFPDATWQAASPEPRGTCASRDCCSPERVLIVHHNELIRELIPEILQAKGPRSINDIVTVIDKYYITSEVLAETDLLITDQLDLCQAIRETRPQMPIVFHASHPDLTTVEGAIVLRSPFTPDDLCRAVEQACATRHNTQAATSNGAHAAPETGLDPLTAQN